MLTSHWEVNAAILLYYQIESDDESSDEDWTEEMYREMSRSIFDLFWMGCGQLEP